jgi:SAM-dependent methyltransferase
VDDLTHPHIITRQTLSVRGRDPQAFDAFAEAYDRFCSLTDRPVWPWLTDLGVAGGGRALDAGCGSGRRTLELAGHFDEVVGIDVSVELLSLARSRRAHPRVRYETADLAVHADGEGFDLVYSSTTLHHVEPLRPALENLRSLVRPGGWAVLSDTTVRIQPWKHWVWKHGGLYVGPFLHALDNVRDHGAADGLRAFRFEVSTPWIRHLLSDRWLRPAEFEAVYLGAFHGGRIEPQPLMTLVWQRPVEA